MGIKRTNKIEKKKCWEFFKCKKKECPVYESKNFRCWLFSGTHCREQIQGKFIEKMEMCVRCNYFKSNIDTDLLKDSIETIDKQFKEYKKIVTDRDKEIRNTSMELALGISEVFEALRKISSGDNSLNLNEKSKIELIGKLKHMVNKTSKEIRKAEGALRKSDERFKQIAENAEEWIWEVNTKGLYTYSSPTIQRVLGYRPDEIIGKKHFYDLFYPKDRKELKKTAFKTFTLKQPFREFLNRNVHKNGKIVWLSTSGVPIFNERGIFFGYRGSDTDITARIQAADELKKSYENLRALSANITKIKETERLKLSIELHDRVGQKLTALNINLDFLIKHLSDESRTSIGSRLHDSKDLVKEIMKLIRNMMADLRPRILDDYGLAAAIHWYSDQFSKRTKIPVSFKGEEIELRLPSDIETNLFRIMQESLTNVAKHAHANKVTITLEEREGKIRLIITDNGIGFDPIIIKQPRKTRGLGLLGIRERAEALGGKLHVESSLGKGTQVIVEVNR